MAEALPSTIESTETNLFKTGHQIIEIVTSGMYSNPLMIYREYIQNAADSIDEALGNGWLDHNEGRISITVDGLSRCISIQDNGAGLSDLQAEGILTSLGLSTKTSERSRGFRGIGRLGGVGYSEIVTFETKHISSSSVTCVTWNAARLRSGLRSAKREADIRSLLCASIRVEKKIPSDQDEPHFFRVKMQGVHRFHRDELMNLPLLGSYLSQVAPVAFDSDKFSWAQEISEHLSQGDGYKTYWITLNSKRILRPHRCLLEANQHQADKVEGVELFTIKGREGLPIGYGWYARTHYLSSLPQRMTMRGIRVRQGNIEVGDEFFLESLFSERRFATWHIGEINLNYSVKVNARRDGFEQSPEYEAFLEQASALARYLSRLCRDSSKERSMRFSATRMLERIELLLDQKFVIDNEHLSTTKETVKKSLERLIKEDENSRKIHDYEKRIKKARDQFVQFEGRTPFLIDLIDGRSLRYTSQKGLIRDLAGAIVRNNHRSASAEELIENLVRPYLKRKRTRSIDKQGHNR